jgi:hypothetical protein
MKKGSINMPIEVLSKFPKWAVVGVGLTTTSTTIDSHEVVATIDPETCVFKVWVKDMLIHEQKCENLLHASQQAQIFLTTRFVELTPEKLIFRLRAENRQLLDRLSEAEQKLLVHSVPFPGYRVDANNVIESVFRVKRTPVALLTSGVIMPINNLHKLKPK